MKSPLARLTLLVAATAVSVSAPDALAGVVDGRYDLQYYLDFCYNKGMFATGATNIEVFFKDGTSIANNTIPLMPNMDSYGQTVSSVIMNKIGSNGGTNLVSAQFVYGAKHVHAKVENSDVAFLSENGSANCIYDSANLDSFGTDSAMQRLTKLVTSVAYTPMADDAFMQTLKINDTWLYRLGTGGTWCDGKSIATGDNSLGGVVNLSVCWQNTNTGEWYLEGWARKNELANDTLTPLDIGTYFGDSGSPFFVWDDKNNQFVFVGAVWAGGCQLSFPNWYLFRYNYQQGSAVMDKYTVAADKFSGTEKIVWGTQDATLGTGTLTQGDISVTYTGKGSGNTIADTLGITFSTTDSENVQTLELAGSVNMGAGALTFESGKWKLSEADSTYTLASAGFEIKKGAELTLDLTGTTSEEIRKVGEGTLTIAGSGNNESKLVVGGGTTVYNVTKDADGNITGCTLGNAGETRLNRTGGYAASSVRLEGGVAIVVLMQDGQFKTNSTAGDTFSFGNDGGLLNLNGHNLEWGVINQNGSGTGARIGNFTPLNGTTPGTATFTYTGTGTFAGSFMDEGNGKALLAVKYNNSAENATWTLTGNSSNYGGFTVEAGTLKLEGTRTPHVRTTDWNDWAYASIETSKVSVKNGATFQLSHHALLNGDVEVEAGGNFVLNQTVNAASESVSGSLRQDMAKLGITSIIGNVSLKGNAAMKVDTTSPVATTMRGNISGETESAFTKTGSGLFVVDGQVAVGTGTVEAGGVVVKNKDGFSGTWTIQDAGFLGVEGMNGDDILSKISNDSTGVLALGADQTTAITNLGNYTNLYIGALGTLTKAVEYGVAGTSDTLSANSENKWLLGGGGGTLNVNFKLTGANSLIIGNDASGGTVHLTNTSNDFSGDIIIKGTGNILTYVNGALGSARVALAYGNTLGLNSAEQLSILKEGAEGVLALTTSYDLNLSDKKTAIGAAGDLTYTGTLTVGDTYRFGGSGDLTLDTDLSKASAMKLDGQGNSGSSVTFARENAFTGTIVAGGGLHLDSANSSGDITLHARHAETFASVSSMTMQKGAMLDTDGRESLVIRNLSAESGSSIKNSGNTATLLQLNVVEGVSTTIADGVLLGANNNATLALVKTGAGMLTMGANSTWNGGLTIAEGTVKASIASGGIGASGASIYVNEGATLSLTANAVSYSNLSSTILPQILTGTGTVNVSNGTEMLLSTQSVSFEGEIVVDGNTRLYVTNGAQITTGGTKYQTSQAFNTATIVVKSGSQARLTSSIQSMSGSAVSSYADYVISGSTYDGSASGLVQSQHNGALVIDHSSTVYGNITLAENATISSWSYNPTSSLTYAGSYTYRCTNSPSDAYANRYGVINKLGGTIRGKILGEGKTLTFGGNEGMTITADSANTYGDLVIANGNGNNTDKFALRLDGGAAKNQTSTALGTGSVTLNKDLILRLAGTGTADSSHVAYTYGNAISAGEGATLQSYNITNRLAGTVTMSGTTLNLSTANGGVLELAGGISGNGTLNVGANSKIILGSASSTMALARSGSAQFSGNVITASGADITLMSPSVVSTTTTFSGTDSLTLRLAGTEDYTLGGITLTGSSVTNDDGTTGTNTTSLTLNFDFSNIPTASDNATWTTLNSAISANTVQISLDLNMFNDISSGEYSLLNGNLSVTDYTLADDLNGRLSLKTDTDNKLFLVVGGDNRLYWRTTGASHNWNTTDANWYLEGNSALKTFSANDNVVLDASGVAEGNSASSRETITLSADQTVGTLAAKDENAFYEVTGTATLSGTNLAVGLGGNLKLSTTNASFSDGVRVDNASLEVSGTALTANVSATNSGSFALSNNASLTGTLSVSGGTMSLENSTVTGNIDLKDTSTAASINASSVTGNIALQGNGSATLNSLTLKGEIATETGGRIMATSNYNGTTATSANATLSGTLSWGSETGSSLSLTSGSLYLDGAVNLSELSVGSGLTVTIWNSEGNSGTDKVLRTVNLADNAILQTNDRNKVTASTSLGTLNLTGTSATLRDQFHPGYYSVDALSIASSVDSATLNIVKNADSTLATVVNLGSENAVAGNFKGTIALNSDTGETGDSNRSVFLVLGCEDVAAGAAINMSASDSSTAVLGLGLNTAKATIAGLSSTSALGNRTKVFSGSVGTEVQWGSSSSAPSTVGGTLRTLTINTESGKSYEFYGEIMSDLNLVKSGAGTQKLLGASNNFNGSIDVQAGTLTLGGISAVGTLSGLSVSSGAILDLSAVGIGTNVAGLTFSEGATASFSSGATIAFGYLEAGTTYRIFNLEAGASMIGWDNSTLNLSNFTIDGVALSEMGRIELALNSDEGTFTYYADRYDLVWSGAESGGTWNQEESNLVWTRTLGDSLNEDPTYFTNYDNAIFNKNASVSVRGDVHASLVTITNGATVSLTGTLSAQSLKIESGKLSNTWASTLTTVKSFDVASGSELEIKFNGTPSYTSEVTGEGAVTLTGGGTMTWNPADGSLSMGTLNITGNSTFKTASVFSATVVNVAAGTAQFDGTMNVDTLTLAAGKTVTLWNDTETEGQSKLIGSLNLGNGATLAVSNRINKTSDSAVIDTVTVNGTGSLKEVYGSGYLKVGTIELATGTTSGTLNLTKASTLNGASYTSIYELGSASAKTGNFAGEVVLSNVNANNNNHSVFITLAGTDTLAKSVVKMNTQASSSAYLGMGIMADGATIAGLESSESLGRNVLLFSGESKQDCGWNRGDENNNAYNLQNSSARTLNIDVAAGESYAYYGRILSNLNLVKKGEGTQAFYGAGTGYNGQNFNGSISVEAGTLIAGHANALGTGAISVASGAVLQANAAIELSAASQALTLVVGDAQVVPAAATYAALRSTDPTGTALITAGESTNGKISVSGDAIVYVDVSALTGTQNALSGETLSLQLATESALAFNDANAKVGWWDESGTSWTDWSLVNSCTYDTASGLLTITIPEPSTFGLLAGLSALALCVSRRKRRK